MPRVAGLVKLHCSIDATGKRQEWAGSDDAAACLAHDPLRCRMTASSP